MDKFVKAQRDISFVMAGPGVRRATDPDTGATLSIRGTPEQDLFRVVYESEEASFQMSLVLQPRLMHEPGIQRDRSNPGIMINSSSMQLYFRSRNMLDRKKNTVALTHALRMVSFIVRQEPLGASTQLWTDYNFTRSDSYLFDMPSNENLSTMPF